MRDCAHRGPAGPDRVPGIDDPDGGRDKKTGQARSTVPRGHYAIGPDPWGAPFVPATAPRQPARAQGRELMRSASWATVSAGPRDNVVVHPDDVMPRLTPFTCGANWAGCCGPTGAHGPELACTCGSRLATWAADCLGPDELHLDPVRVYAWHQKPLPYRSWSLFMESVDRTGVSIG
ncbi:hypothetical protein [Streptomyces sp. NPDC057052]|uniref:hypothetical protein n=1 Tax=Streptomyces sp. NPDC057052 TaxID=3346010 RepID=UPI003626D7D8